MGSIGGSSSNVQADFQRAGLELKEVWFEEG
jgi:hypothetical protein